MDVKPPEAIKDRVKAIKALADDKRAPKGERQAASAMLAKLLKKYGISEADLASEEKILHPIKFKTERERRIIVQLYAHLYALDSDIGFAITKKGRKRRNVMMVRMTPAQFIDFEAQVAFYRNLFEIETDRLYQAFLMKHDLFPKDGTPEKVRDMDQLKELHKLQTMASTLRSDSYHKQLGS